MNAKEIVKKYLIENGYDGLYTVDCGCVMNDLMPCCAYTGECKPGVKKIVGEDWIVGPRIKE